MAEYICIDDDDDGIHENDKSSDFAEDERSLRRLRRNSVKMKLSHGVKEEREKVDERYAFFLNYYAAGFAEDKDCFEGDVEADMQYGKFLSLLKPYKSSYALDFGKADGMSKMFVYEEEDEVASDVPTLAHISGNLLGGKIEMGFKSVNESSEARGRSVLNDKIGMEDAEHKESFIDGSELTSLKSVQVRSIDVNYLFYLGQILNGKHAEKLNCFQDYKKRKIMSGDVSATKNTPRNRVGKKPRYSDDTGEGMKATDAKISQIRNGDQQFGMTEHLRQKKEIRHGGELRHCKNLRNSRQKTITTKATQKYVGMQGANGKLHKRYQLAVDHENNARKSVASKVNQEANGLSGYSEPGTKRILADSVTKDSVGQHALHARQSSGNKSSLKNHNQPEALLGFDRPTNESYKAFLNGLSEYEGKLVFLSNEGKVVTYKQDLKKSTDSDTDSDSVIIIGESENGKSRDNTPSYFERKLNNILLKPYDEKEYESLMKKAHERLPREGHRDMRAGLGTYKKDNLGKSLLDHHQDVAKAIKECRGDRQKIMPILRGFIFWLEHSPDDEAFIPWKRKEYLEVQPRRSSLRNVKKAKAN